ncbi:alginate O-acetyltransferase complex protein AlgI [Tepidamorphus gemmatus]|uniref:Probable alginate O-acetylase AlgI n=1 Tax=Tepidamorphus gemmatus TaxID=747076 RepID=A0A4R3M6R1_9HYPH|nr:MBOAT family protein [Tepidamorphus gemmatus]TCT07237.1 alginate O-acetyltransferase complex protein AlgI [Tepidamorphus gemmatus]
MVFSSIEFLFFFLPAAVGVYFLVPIAGRNLVLLAASLIFYLWGSGALVLILLVSILVNYGLGALVGRATAAGDRRLAGLSIAAAVLANLAILGYFKYANFIVLQINAVGDQIGLGTIAWDGVVLPIGISFYTFQAMSYVFDVARGAARPARSLLDFALYVSMFPQLVAGPIVRYAAVAKELRQRSTRLDDFAEGAQRFALGLIKKVVIADSLAPMADAAFASSGADLTFATAWIGLVAYTIQIYFDFSGYSDMAIGLGRVLGFRFPENFDRPYSAHSITEFWRRWHMSLSSWFRDYVYVPLGGNRLGTTRTYLNLWLVFLITGLWHGAAWTFVAWGAWHGMLLAIERATGWREKRFTSLPAVIGARALTLLLVMMGWVLFRAENLPAAWAYFTALASPDLTGMSDPMVRASGNRALLTLGLASLVFLLPRRFRMPDALMRDDVAGKTARTLVLIIGYPYALVLVVAGAFTAFIYFQF